MTIILNYKNKKMKGMKDYTSAIPLNLHACFFDSSFPLFLSKKVSKVKSKNPFYFCKRNLSHVGLMGGPGPRDKVYHYIKTETLKRVFGQNKHPLIPTLSLALLSLVRPYSSMSIIGIQGQLLEITGNTYFHCLSIFVFLIPLN